MVATHAERRCRVIDRYRAIRVSGGSYGYTAIVIEQAPGILRCLGEYEGPDALERAAKVADEANAAYLRAQAAAEKVGA